VLIRSHRNLEVKLTTPETLAGFIPS